MLYLVLSLVVEVAIVILVIVIKAITVHVVALSIIDISQSGNWRHSGSGSNICKEKMLVVIVV